MVPQRLIEVQAIPLPVQLSHPLKKPLILTRASAIVWALRRGTDHPSRAIADQTGWRSP
jgi:hypothetical protein